MMIDRRDDTSGILSDTNTHRERESVFIQQITQRSCKVKEGVEQVGDKMSPQLFPIYLVEQGEGPFTHHTP